MLTKVVYRKKIAGDLNFYFPTRRRDQPICDCRLRQLIQLGELL
jgi:hypothetical protein